MKKGYKHKFDRIVFTNRWKQSKMKYWGDYTLIGICHFVFSTTEYEWRFCFFGLDLRIWMIKEWRE